MKKWARKNLNFLAYIGIAILLLMLIDHFLGVALEGWNNPF